jgi:hypothetical protein
MHAAHSVCAGPAQPALLPCSIDLKLYCVYVAELHGVRAGAAHMLALRHGSRAHP